MEFNEVIKKRRTTREFSDKEVDYESIEKIIEAGTLAPSNNHLRQWDFVVVDDRMEINMISKCVSNYSANPNELKNPYEDMCKYAFPRQKSMLESAKYIILPMIRENNVFKATSNFQLMHYADIWCVIENMFLKATDLGLGCSMHAPSRKEEMQMFEITRCKSGYVIPCIIGIGYPSESAYFPEEVEFDKNRIHINRW